MLISSSSSSKGESIGRNVVSFVCMAGIWLLLRRFTCGMVELFRSIPRVIGFFMWLGGLKGGYVRLEVDDVSMDVMLVFLRNSSISSWIVKGLVNFRHGIQKSSRSSL